MDCGGVCIGGWPLSHFVQYSEVAINLSIVIIREIRTFSVTKIITTLLIKTSFFTSPYYSDSEARVRVLSQPGMSKAAVWAALSDGLKIYRISFHLGFSPRSFWGGDLDPDAKHITFSSLRR